MDFELLSKYKIAYPECSLAKSRKEAASIAKRIGFPVAMKIVSPEVLHKTDLGGVALGLQNANEVEKTYDALADKFRGKKVDGILVQQMVGKGAVELIIGGKRDAQFGQMIM
ncbi:MAG: acetate--CoA ligase family protein, partial [Candidatus Micrarchaeota archaeon]|nr:acetate--CoA ligase family protein [Candidatus Micrarchaeota archaeon]